MCVGATSLVTLEVWVMGGAGVGHSSRTQADKIRPMTIRKSVRLATVSAGVCSLVLAGCSSAEQTEANETVNSVGASASGVVGDVGDRAESLFDDAEVRTFVLAFRAQFGALAESRDDAAIEELLTNTCAEIASGADESAIVAELEVEAASGEAKPSTEQAQRIFDQAELACP